MKKIISFVDKIICGDCLEVMKELPSNSVDFVLTDPPYLVNYRSRDGRSYANDNPKHAEWLEPVFQQVFRVLKHNRLMVCFYGWNRADRFLGAWKSAGFYPVGHFVWVKRYHSKELFVRYSHECAYLLAKGRPAKPRIMLRDVLDWRYTGDILHPTQKPVMAILPLINAFSQYRDIVLDPFAGSGTTAFAAAKLGRRYIGIEINTKYYRIARERLKQNKHEEQSPQMY